MFPVRELDHNTLWSIMGEVINTKVVNNDRAWMQATLVVQLRWHHLLTSLCCIHTVHPLLLFRPSYWCNCSLPHPIYWMMLSLDGQMVLIFTPPPSVNNCAGKKSWDQPRAPLMTLTEYICWHRGLKSQKPGYGHLQYQQWFETC